ncbi:hypothetical protein [Dictyobacter kobayashii]|uniref:Polymerase nucleotidyl transferase domain-containing protein n=1 Tax=Dictyobacter kobayashii TaxID=2014872 RepID=A0A402AZ96_9CHLR|nr:hypothetical protein [Dictyobacter kobayashii]GCE24385.1 hypothetical protein KDK_81850 [Dictyobacter kobayashii]
MQDDMLSTNSRELQQSEYDEQLLQRQKRLQTEAQQILEELKVVEKLSQVGQVRQTGSTTLGLMVWRDIDLQVSSPGLSAERAFTIMQPLLSHPYIKQVRYLHQSEHFKVEGLDERHFFMLFYQFHEPVEWKLDISFWLGEGIHPEPLHEAIEQQLTHETRLLILRIKDVWYQLPAYRNTVASTDIYDAVLQHGVRTLDDFDQYLSQRGKPTRHHS